MRRICQRSALGSRRYERPINREVLPSSVQRSHHLTLDKGPEQASVRGGRRRRLAPAVIASTSSGPEHASLQQYEIENPDPGALPDVSYWNSTDFALNEMSFENGHCLEILRSPSSFEDVYQVSFMT